VSSRGCDDFRDGYVDIGTSITTMAARRDRRSRHRRLPGSDGEQRVLRLAASLADGIPVDQRDAFTGMNAANVDKAVRAMLHPSGRRHGNGLNVQETGEYRTLRISTPHQ
jgi:hypothetical protein